MSAEQKSPGMRAVDALDPGWNFWEHGFERTAAAAIIERETGVFELTEQVKRLGFLLQCETDAHCITSAQLDRAREQADQL